MNKLMNKLLYWWSGRLPITTIDAGDGNPYLERYWVGKWFGVTVYLHRFVSADDERYLHNHPWKRGFSLILNGGYTEERLTDLCADGIITDFYQVRWFNRVDGNKFHRILSPSQGTWTLFFKGPPAFFYVDEGCGWHRKRWGFIDRGASFDFIEGPESSVGWHLSAPLGCESARKPEDYVYK